MWCWCYEKKMNIMNSIMPVVTCHKILFACYYTERILPLTQRRKKFSGIFHWVSEAVFELAQNVFAAVDTEWQLTCQKISKTFQWLRHKIAIICYRIIRSIIIEFILRLFYLHSKRMLTNDKNYSSEKEMNLFILQFLNSGRLVRRKISTDQWTICLHTFPEYLFELFESYHPLHLTLSA